MCEKNSEVSPDTLSEILIELRCMNQRMEKMDEIMTGLFREVVRYRTEWEVQSEKSGADIFLSNGVAAMAFFLSLCMWAFTVFQLVNTEVWDVTTQWMVIVVIIFVLITSVILVICRVR